MPDKSVSDATLLLIVGAFLIIVALWFYLVLKRRKEENKNCDFRTWASFASKHGLDFEMVNEPKNMSLGMYLERTPHIRGTYNGREIEAGIIQSHAMRALYPSVYSRTPCSGQGFSLTVEYNVMILPSPVQWLLSTLGLAGKKAKPSDEEFERQFSITTNSNEAARTVLDINIKRRLRELAKKYHRALAVSGSSGAQFVGGASLSHQAEIRKILGTSECVYVETRATYPQIPACDEAFLLNLVELTTGLAKNIENVRHGVK